MDENVAADITGDVAGASAPLPSTNELAMERNRLAMDRTMMAWVRTATSLISFGFTIYKFFEYMTQSGQARADGRSIGAREFGMLMIAAGVITLAIATFEHYRAMREFRRISGRKVYSLATVPAALISVLGLAALIAVWFRL
jgi:putative membrane protein